MGIGQEIVFGELESFAMAEWSSDEVALALNVTERRVRAAIGWLLHNGFVERVGKVKRITSGGYPYWTGTYRMTGRRLGEEVGEADWESLYRVLGLR